MSGQRGRWKQGEERITAKLDEKTMTVLKEQDRRFADAHREADAEELVRYIRAEAERLGRSPCPGELCGGKFIEERFGGWREALKAAGLPPLPGKPPGLRRLERYKREFRRQAKLRRLELSEDKSQRRLDHQKKSWTAAAEQKRLAERPVDLEWVAAHQHDTDEALLAYLRRCADNLGHTPSMREVLGGLYISKRFGNWGVAIHEAGLPFRKGMKRPKQNALDAYRKAHPLGVRDQ